MNLAYPLHFDGRGRTATANNDDYLRGLIEQVLFTAPGERVNRPSFGAGLNQLVFAPNSGELAGATQLLVQASLQQWLGNLIAVETVEVSSLESTLRVRVQYVVRRTAERRSEEFTRGGVL
jgi:phage baseplate assembly protein W